MRKLLMALLIWMLLPGPLRVARAQDDELEALRLAAEAEAEQPVETEEETAKTTFKSGSLGLQTLNPEISVTGDIIGMYQSGDDSRPDWDFTFRGLGIHCEAYLDPYSRFKAAFPVSEGGATLGEAYFTRYGTLGGGSLTLGKFRQQFGVVNRWHKHGLDYVDFPLPLREVFGPGGLNQTGVSLDWNGPLGGASQEFTLQVTDGDNPRVFGENAENRPSILAHYKLNRDISASTYCEVGLTGLWGWNDEWVVDIPSPAPDTYDYDTRTARVYGIDFTVLWEPTYMMRYRNVEWRTELYCMDKDIRAPDGTTGRDSLRPWGVYTSLQAKVSRTVDVGGQLGYFRPDVKGYASTADLSLSPLAVTEDDAHRWLGALYLTWWQSPFVKFRVQYEREDGSGMGDPVDRVMLQCVFAAGPHKHERY